MTKDHRDDKAVIAEKLSANPLFTGLEDFYFRDIIAVGEVRSWPKGSQIIVEGEAGDAVYFILQGRVKVTLYGEEGKEIVLSVLNDGDMFGELSIMDNRPRSANVVSVKDLECLVVTKEAFLKYLSRHHKVYLTMFAYLTGRLRDATRQIGGLALLDVCGRIAHTLMGISREGADTEQKVVEIERPTHEELAAMIGSSREVVSRALKKMTQDGYIKIEKDRILMFMD
ncbi:MAG: Crp/Fnr family transcriptional regulator [Thermodesulfobacteriota bacterium]